MRWVIVTTLFILLISPCWGRQVAGVELAEQVVPGESGEPLLLNGAGIREKFFVDVYVAALYLPRKTDSAAAALDMKGRKRVAMHFLRAVDRSKIVDGWTAGFRANASTQTMTALTARLDDFNRMFGDVEKGQTLVFDYLPNQGTRVSVGGEQKGVVAGEDFFRALLAIWIGDRPVNGNLKKALLAG